MNRFKFIFIVFLFSCKSDKIIIHYDDFKAEKYLPNSMEYIEQSKMRQGTIDDPVLENKLFGMLDSLSKMNGIEKGLELDFRLLLKLRNKRHKLVKIYFDNTGLFKTNITGDKIYLADKSILDLISSRIEQAQWYYPPKIN